MAKYTVTFSCGHTDTIDLVGPMKDRDRKLAFAREQGLCPTCYKTRKDTRQNEETEIARQMATSNAWPDLKDGTAKQIAYAQRIRAAVLATEDNDVRKQLATAIIIGNSRLREVPDHGLTKELVKSLMQGVENATKTARQQLERQSSVRWWIDNGENHKRFVSDTVDAAMNAAFPMLFDKKPAPKPAQQNPTVTNDLPKATDAQMKGFHPKFVHLSGEDLILNDQHGRIAKGFIDYGDWGIYLVDGARCDTLAAEALRIAREAKALLSVASR